MSLEEAQATGWLGDPHVSCAESLGLFGDADVRAFDLEGAQAPPDLSGEAEFVDGELIQIEASGGAMVAGVLPLGGALSRDEAVARLGRAGYTLDGTSFFEETEYLELHGPGGEPLVVTVPNLTAGIPDSTPCE
jgi:hypothetical protein